MNDHQLLIRHAKAWARSRHGAPLDDVLLSQVLGLRAQHQLSYGWWPAGSVDALLAMRWSVDGPSPGPAELGATLATFWRFLADTGRMDEVAAPVAALEREAEQCLHRHAQPRTDPGSRVPPPELQAPEPEPTPPEPPIVTPGRPQESARCAQEAPYVAACLALADWVGTGREVTGTGVLRPAVAREAYQHLDLWPWERDDIDLWMGAIGLPCTHQAPEHIRAQRTLAMWRSARDCVPLQRLWRPCVDAGLIQIRGRRARAAWVRPREDEQWRDVAVTLTVALGEAVDAELLGKGFRKNLVTLLRAGCEAEDPPTLEDLGARRQPNAPVRLEEESRPSWADVVLFRTRGCGLWEVQEGTLRTTDLGRDVFNACAPRLAARPRRAGVRSR